MEITVFSLSLVQIYRGLTIYTHVVDVVHVRSQTIRAFQTSIVLSNQAAIIQAAIESDQAAIIQATSKSDQAAIESDQAIVQAIESGQLRGPTGVRAASWSRLAHSAVEP
jgi:hypothetical protein